MHARRAFDWRAVAPSRKGFRHFLTVVWATCLLAGVVLLGNFGYGMWKGVSDEDHLTHVWQQELQAPGTPTTYIDPSLKQPVHGVDFAIRIPKLSYFAAVKEGVDSGVLYAGPGHYPTSRWPGDPGTVGVAAHNVYWIRFPELKKGDEIDLETRYGVYKYRVVSMEIVDPDDRTALVVDADGYGLALTTCWPLWAGAFATQRYVIHAVQFSPVPTHTGNRS
jgi:sortase A